MSVKVTDAQRLLYKTQHENKSDKELEAHITNLSLQVLSIPTSSPGAIERMSLLLAEQQVCQEILEKRKEKMDNLAVAHQRWEDLLPERRYAAVKNLSTAITPNGQLIAAILEEEGALTEHEIATWCDELEALDDSDLHDLLTSLTKEGVLTMSNDKYELKQICTETLFPAHSLESIGRLVKTMVPPMPENPSDIQRKINEAQQIICRIIDLTETAICAEDFPSITTGYEFRLAVEEMGYPKDTVEKKIQEWGKYLTGSSSRFNVLLRGTNLHRSKIDEYTMFYFPMLGEEE